MKGELRKEDYQESSCPLCMKIPGEGQPSALLPLGRVLEKLDEYLDTEDWGGAERHLSYWLAEADACGDEKSKLSLLNEKLGFLRKQGREREALDTVQKVLTEICVLDMEDSITSATSYINAATVYKAFRRAPEALPLFDRAETIYLKHLSQDDSRLGGLYNNRGLALFDCGRIREAEASYRKALSIMVHVPGSEPEQAITLLNLADCAAVTDDEAALSSALAEAEALLKKPSIPRDAYYCYVAIRCSEVFSYHGWFAAAAELKQLAEDCT